MYNPTKTDQSEEAKVVVAEIKRKMDPDTNVVLGKYVFLLCLKAGIDGAFIVALLLVLDQVEGHDFKEGRDKLISRMVTECYLLKTMKSLIFSCIRISNLNLLVITVKSQIVTHSLILKSS